MIAIFITTYLLIGVSLGKLVYTILEADDEDLILFIALFWPIIILLLIIIVPIALINNKLKD